MTRSNPVGIYCVDYKWITVTMLGVYMLFVIFISGNFPFSFVFGYGIVC